MMYRWEPLNYLLNTGLSELGARSWSEIGNDTHIFHYDPDWFRYQELQDQNMLRFLAVRDEDEILVGYASVIIMQNLHDRKVTCAVIQDIYLAPENRKGYKSAREFLLMLELQLKKMNVKHMSIAERENDPRGGVGAVYRRLGYKSAERIWTKGL